MILADDLGWNDVGFHGSEIRTPRLDALAKESVLLDRHYVQPSCSPTRAAVMTGRNPSRFGILGPLGMDPKTSLPLETVTLAELLAGAGYATGHVGKWHLGPTFEYGPRRQGFHEAYGYLHGQLDQFSHVDWDLQHNNWFRDEKLVDEPGHATDLLAREAVDFIRRRAAKPFFLYLCFSVPHYPLQDEEKWIQPYEATIAHKDRRINAAMVTHMDDAIGRVLDALDAARVREKTLVIFSSDNGGQKNWMQTKYGGKHGPYEVLGDNRPLRGWKTELYEGGVRVVALAHWRGTLAPRTVEEVTRAEDILPTAARLAGATVAPEMKVEGGDLWPLLTGAGRRDPPVLLWNAPGVAGIRVGDWKLIEFKRTRKLELYDLRSDPLETADRATDQPERVRELHAKLTEAKGKDPRP